MLQASRMVFPQDKFFFSLMPVPNPLFFSSSAELLIRLPFEVKSFEMVGETQSFYFPFFFRLYLPIAQGNQSSVASSVCFLFTSFFLIGTSRLKGRLFSSMKSVCCTHVIPLPFLPEQFVRSGRSI